MFGRTKKITKKITTGSTRMVSNWMGLDAIKSGGHYINSSVRSLISMTRKQNPDEPAKTFEQVIQENGITEEKLKVKEQLYLKKCLMYLFIGLAVFIYACFMLYQGHVVPFLSATAVATTLFVFAFGAHFWVFQIRRRSLSCRFNEWFLYVLKGE